MNLYRRLLAIGEEEVTFGGRGFPQAEKEPQELLETVGRFFLSGYHAALEETETAALGERLNRVGPRFRGFAFEGAAMGLVLRDFLSPWRRPRFPSFLDGPGSAHIYMVHVGVGWALARLPLGHGRILARLDPVVSWLAFDGYGFHQGYFHWPRAVEGRREVPRRLAGYARRAFDQGLGRSLWFVSGADVGRVSERIGRFAASRHADLWSGVGLACAYAGGVDSSVVEALRRAAAGFEGHLAQGAAFAAEVRTRAGNPAEHTTDVCRVLCGCDGTEAAEIARRQGRDLPIKGPEPAYEVWRRRTRKALNR